MIVERPSGQRGHVQAGWLDSHHTFSFGSYYDKDWMGFGALRVINEDRVAARGGFAPHRHANMEILSYVIDGALQHRDNLGGGGGVIKAGELQWMSAGHGVEHSEFNASQEHPVHFLQIWLQPDRVNTEPGYAQREARPLDEKWQLMASPDGADGSLAIRQDARLSVVRLRTDQSAQQTLSSQRRYWLQVVSGRLDVAGRTLGAGDALGWVEEDGELSLQGGDDAQVLWFDLPG